MGQPTEIEIDIDGHSVKYFSSFRLSQNIFEHHTFQLVCPLEVFGEFSGPVLNKTKALIGSLCTVLLRSVDEQGMLQFSGMVTQVEAGRRAGYHGDIVISGFSPTILLDGSVHCKSWEKKTLKQIAQKVLLEFPGNLLQPDIEPSYSEKLSYTVQYKETAWQFLKRLSAFHGEWLLYDGQRLSLGSHPTDTTELISGCNLESFDIALQVRPSTFQMISYDYIKSEVYSGSPQGIAGKAGLNDLGRHTLEKSERFFGHQPKQWHNQFVTSRKQLDEFITTRAATESSNMVRFRGRTSNTKLTVGGLVSVSTRNQQSESDEKLGDYRVISLDHYCDGLGNYSNDMEAIPASFTYPPIDAAPHPHCETQSAFVTDNHDPNGLARIRVRFHWMGRDEKSPWLRVTTPHAGVGKGMFMMPEIGEEVIVGFEGDSATKPYIIGAVYHGKANNSYANEGNDVKAWQSRSGNKVVMNDKDGSVHVQDSKGNDMIMDGAGNINVKSSESIVFVTGKAKVTMKQDGIIEILSSEKITMTAKDIEMNASTIVMNSGDVFINASKNEKGAGGSLIIDAKKKMNATVGGNDLRMDGENNAVSMNSISNLTISASAVTEIKGGEVQINKS